VGPDGYLGNGINFSNWMLVEGAIDSRNLPQLMDASDIFAVGSLYNKTATKSGYLYLGIYDFNYTDNAGNYCASVGYCNNVSLTTRATLYDGTNTFAGGAGTNICKGIPVGAIDFGNVFFSCEFDGNYRVGIKTCFWDGSIGLSSLGSYNFNIGSTLYVTNAEKDVILAQDPPKYSSLNGRYLILSHGPIYSVIQKISNSYP
jgi:hypothetical protein